jgi:hypothetical protein
VVVQQDQVRAFAPHQAQGFTHVAGLPAHGEALVLHQQSYQATSKKGVVIDDQ